MKIRSINHGQESILIILSCDHITSVNNLYNARVGKKNGKPYPIIYKSPDALALTQDIEPQLDSINFEEDAKWIWEADYFTLTIQFVMNRGINSRDCSNCIKLTEDILFRRLKLNDSRNIDLHAYKRFLPEASEEYIMIELSKSKSDVMFRAGVD